MILNSKQITERGFAAIIDAYKNNNIKFEQCKINHDIFLHYDEPNNIPRFSIDWIVEKEYRNQGIGKQLVLHAIEDFLSLLSPIKGQRLFIEAVVDQDNEISKQVARSILGNEQENLNAKISSFLKEYQF